TAKAVGTYEGLDFKAPVKKPVSLTTWNYAELFMDPLPSGSSVELWYKINKTGSFIQAKTAHGDSNFGTVNGKKAVFRIQEEGEIFEPRIVLNPIANSSPEVHRMRVFFS
ncbi:MAG: hypothetical protein NUV73_04115, partial [Candidatus Daviesbacteria bacterium]|nr:hypothetical protein [Candidatus Daviesbacteria bacterium]